MAKLRGSDLDTSDWGPPLSQRRSGCLAAERSAYLANLRFSGVDPHTGHCPTLPVYASLLLSFTVQTLETQA